MSWQGSSVTAEDPRKICEVCGNEKPCFCSEDFEDIDENDEVGEVEDNDL